MILNPLYLKSCWKYTSDRVTLLSSSSTTKPFLQVFSFRMTMPPGRRPLAQRSKKATKSSSVRCPMHHWTHTTSSEAAAGANASRPTPSYANVLPSRSRGARLARAWSRKWATGSTSTKSSKKPASTSCVTRPIPAPQSATASRPPPRARRSSRPRSTFPANAALSRASVAETCPNPPSTPSTVGATPAQYPTPFRYHSAPASALKSSHRSTAAAAAALPASGVDPAASPALPPAIAAAAAAGSPVPKFCATRDGPTGREEGSGGPAAGRAPYASARFSIDDGGRALRRARASVGPYSF